MELGRRHQNEKLAEALARQFMESLIQNRDEAEEEPVVLCESIEEREPGKHEKVREKAREAGKTQQQMIHDDSMN